MYRSLEPQKIVETAETLHRRIAERLPDSGLSRVGAELLTLSRDAAAVSEWLAAPHWMLRLTAGAGIILMMAIVVGIILSLRVDLGAPKLAELLQGLEAGINEIIFLGIAVFFLLTLERRMKRRRALKAIHELRSIAHIIDMHQLTKDPERVTNPTLDTTTSPKRVLTPFQLTRYLDYCSEMLAIISKIAALYVQKFDDPVTLSAVNDVEELAAGLSRTIWQKIVILDRILFAGQTIPPESPYPPG